MSSDKKLTASLPAVVKHGLLDLWSCCRVVHGYSRLLQSDRLGPMTEPQQHVVAQLVGIGPKFGRILSQIERLLVLEDPDDAGRWQRNERIALGPLLSEAVAEIDAAYLEPMGPVDIQADAGEYSVSGNYESLKWALSRIVRFQGWLMLDKRGLSIRIVDPPHVPERWIVLAPTENIKESIRHPRHSLTPLPDYYRGHLHFDLAFGNRIIRAYGGEILALPGELGVVVALPRPGEGQSG
jgi:hypothetical protein